MTTQTQTLPMGPVASQEAIKELGTNGGGFFNANSAHPFENPTALSNFMEIAAILLIPLALTYTFGVMVGDRRQGFALMAAMLILFAAMAAVAFVSEQGGNPLTASRGRRCRRQHLPVGWQHGRQGDALRYRGLRLVRLRQPPAHRPARSTACTIP